MIFYNDDLGHDAHIYTYIYIYNWLVQKKTTLLRPFARHLVGKMAIQAAHLGGLRGTFFGEYTYRVNVCDIL